MTATFTPKFRGRHGEPGRCWDTRRRDRIAWRLFTLVAQRDHAHVVWDTYARTRRATSTTWDFGEGNQMWETRW